MLALISISVFDNLLLEAFCVGVIETLEICKYVKARNLRNVQVFLKVDNTLSCINGLSCQTLKCLRSNIVDNERKKVLISSKTFIFVNLCLSHPQRNRPLLLLLSPRSVPILDWPKSKLELKVFKCDHSKHHCRKPKIFECTV